MRVTSCTQRATSDGGHVPCSVITRVTRLAGYVEGGVPHVHAFDGTRQHLGRVALLYGMSAPVAQAASTVDAGAAT